jgi:hypothetical protein
MSFERWGYKLEGPYTKPEYVPNYPGIYVVECVVDDDWFVLDVGQTKKVREKLQDNERLEYWSRHCPKGQIQYAMIDTHNLPEGERIRIEHFIKQQAKPVCGMRKRDVKNEGKEELEV